MFMFLQTLIKIAETIPFIIKSWIITFHIDWKLICRAAGVTIRQQPRRRQLQPSPISQEVIANSGVNSHLWCQKCQLNPTDILAPLSCPDLLTRSWQQPSALVGEASSWVLQPPLACRAATDKCLLSGAAVRTVNSQRGRAQTEPDLCLSIQ